MSLVQTANFIMTHPVSRTRTFRNLDRFISWQITSRLATRLAPRDFEFVNGTRLHLERGMAGATGNYYVGLHEFDAMGFALHLLRRDDYFADVGANIGSFSVIAGAACHADVISFEPEAATFQWLKRNIALNRAEARIEAIEAAAGDHTGTVFFTSGLGPCNHVVGSQDQGVAVAMTTLDTTLKRVPVLMKLDTEGHEQQVLAGARELVRDNGLKCLIAEIQRGAQAETVLAEAGFKRRHYDPLTRQFSDFVPGDQVFVRDEEFVIDRVRTAPAFAVHGCRF